MGLVQAGLVSGSASIPRFPPGHKQHTSSTPAPVSPEPARQAASYTRAWKGGGGTWGRLDPQSSKTSSQHQLKFRTMWQERSKWEDAECAEAQTVLAAQGKELRASLAVANKAQLHHKCQSTDRGIRPKRSA